MRLSKPDIKYLRSLTQKKFRELEKKFLLEGWKPLEEALASDWRVELVACMESATAGQAAILEHAKRKSIPIKEISEKEFGQISSTVHSQGVVAVMRQREHSLEKVLSIKSSMIVALDAVSDPGNLGSIIRSCDWFGVDAVLLGKGCVELYNEKVLRSTVGSIFHLPIVEAVDLPVTLKKAQQAGYVVATLSGDGTESYTSGKLKPPTILVFGSEAHGVNKEVRAASNMVLSIPRFGSAESLNVGVACGIVLAHVRTKN